MDAVKMEPIRKRKSGLGGIRRKRIAWAKPQGRAQTSSWGSGGGGGCWGMIIYRWLF